MSTFGLKLAAVVVVVIGGIIIATRFLPSNITPETEKTFYDVAEEDREEFLTKPEQIKKGEEGTEKPGTTEDAKSTESSENRVKEITLYFKELSEIDKVQAEKLLNVAVPARSMTRLPAAGAGLNLMVQNCRRIIEKWPDSWYAFRAKQLLDDIPERFQKRKNISVEELDISRYFQEREDTQPFKIKIQE